MSANAAVVEASRVAPDWSSAAPSADARFVTSRDGTRIGYRVLGRGPGLLLVQGAMGTAHNFDELGRALASDFRVYLPDRRGRGLSPRTFSQSHAIERDVDDLETLLRETGARFVFGLSSGAIITLAALRALPEIRKAVLYEPPLYLGSAPVAAIARFNAEIERGHFDAAMVTMMGIVGIGPGALGVVPRSLLQLASKIMLAVDRRTNHGPYAPLHELLTAMRFDFRAVQQMAGQLASLASVKAEVLLLGGTHSPRYLRDALAALEQTLPHRRHIEFRGLDHSAPWNTDRGGRPDVVAKPILDFLK
jgi:pimeloyl-ACP methyl ester carboxylesterase